MRRTAVSFFLASSLLAASVGIASAAPTKGCANAASGFQPIALNFTWQPGDAVPAADGDAWWDLTLAGILAEGETPDSVAALFGLADGDALYELVLLNIRTVDANGDGRICWKPFPANSKGKTAYFFNVVEGNAAQH